ncbi:MAG: SGNH/GDSL hydrolase family protein [Candidatus Saccharimonas sp.]
MLMRAKYLLLFCSIITSIIINSSFASAWTGNNYTIKAEEYDEATYKKDIEQPERLQPLPIIGSDGQMRVLPARVTHGKNIRLAYVPLSDRWVIAIGADTNYHYFSGFNDALWPVVLPGTNMIVMPIATGSPYGYQIAMSKDITRDVVPMYAANGQITLYELNYNSLDYWLQYTNENGQMRRPGVYNYVFSANRQYGVFWLNWKNFVRVDYKTGTAKVFSNRAGNWYDSPLYRDKASAITNDGRYVFMNNGASMIDITPECGVTINPLYYDGTVDEQYVRCPETVINIKDAIGYDDTHSMFRLAPDEKSATYMLTTNSYMNMTYHAPKRITVINEKPAPAQLSYLALGDSYSSGEGDTELDPTTKTKYYLPGTDVNGSGTVLREKCHISSRSYPMILGASMNIRQATKSVACSGAKINDVIGEDEYKGQLNDDKKPRLQSAPNIEALQTDALNNYTPGRVRQVEFVKKVQPKVITLTAGGNDAQFASILQACINIPIVSKDLTPTCYFADSTSGRNSLRNLISVQYEPLKKLYASLHDASPNSKIYVIGYPQFINDTAADDQCTANVRLNKAERVMIKESVLYMNSVIKQAAAAAGVKYIDITDALKGHALCDNKQNPWQNYVTGIALKGASEVQESYHPNDGGHIAIANAIKRAVNNQPLLDYVYCSNEAVFCPDTSVTAPEAPSYFVTSEQVRQTIPLPITPTTIEKGVTVAMTIDPLTVQPNGSMAVTMLSEVRQLGNILTTSDGGIRGELRVPADLEPGFHTIILTGKSYSGDPIEIVHFVEVIASQSDRDGDGILDGADPCLYVAPQGEDLDKDGVDDGCDPFISEPVSAPSGPVVPPTIATETPKSIPSANNKLQDSVLPASQLVSTVFVESPLSAGASAAPKLANVPVAALPVSTIVHNWSLPNFVWLLVGLICGALTSAIIIRRSKKTRV